MVFASPPFLFLFLPAVVALYLALPRRAGNAVLLFASIAFYVWGEGLFIALVLASIAFNWMVGRRVGKAPTATIRGRWLALGVGGNLVVLGVLKYANFALANTNALLATLHWGTVALAAIPLPLGISFFTFHSISYLVDVYRRNAIAQHRIDRYALYILLFPQLIAGPIIRYKDIAAQIAARERRSSDFAGGARRFVLGLGKKVLVANTLGRVADQVFGIEPAELHAGAAWIGLVCYAMQIYFDFSGYSDMAIGLMRMFGFRVLENFNYPYISQSIREFWRRWHISLSNFFRDYLYVPLGGSRRGKVRGYINLAIVFLLCGLWHGASWTFVLWGIWHGAFLMIERAGLDVVLARGWRPLRHVYAMLAVLGGWVLFRCDTLGHAGSYFAALAGAGADTASKYPLAMLLNNLVLATLAVAALGAMPFGRWLAELIDRRMPQGAPRNAAFAAELAWLAMVLLGSCAFLAAGTYNPFIYFRF